MKRLLGIAGDLLAPRGASCLLCGDPERADARDSLCPACRRELGLSEIVSRVCEICLTPLPEGGKCEFCEKGGLAGVDCAYAPYWHIGYARRLVLMLKFKFNDDAALALSLAMAEALPGSEDADLLAPVPLHPKRLRERAANQAQVLCRYLSVLRGIPVVSALKRTRATRRQTGLNTVEDREENVRNAFEATENLAGRRVILVDDVRTSGGTARACAKALREAGAERVCLLTATVALPRGNAPGAWLPRRIPGKNGEVYKSKEG